MKIFKFQIFAERLLKLSKNTRNQVSFNTFKLLINFSGGVRPFGISTLVAGMDIYGPHLY